MSVREQPIPATTEEIARRILDLEATVKKTQGVIKGLKEDLSERLYGPIEKAFEDQHKTTGQVTIHHDAVKITAKIDKKVSWDGNKLLDIMRDMSFEKATNLFDIGVSMKEAKFKALEEAAKLEGDESESHKILDGVKTARAIKISAAQITKIEVEPT